MPELPNIEGLIQKIDELIKQLKANNGNNANGDGGNRGVDLSGVKQGASDLGTLFGNLARDGGALAVVFKAIARDKDPLLSVFEQIASKGGDIAKGTAKAISNAIKSTEEMTKYGGDTDTEQQYRLESATRVEFKDLRKAMQEVGTGGSSFGTLTGDRLKNISETLQKITIDSTKRFAGGTTDPETLAKALIISSQNSRGNLANQGDQDRAAINAGKLADEIDKTSAATGRGRDEIANELSARIKNNQALLVQFGNNEEARQSYIRSQAALARHGQAVVDLSNDFMRFGTATEKTMGTLVALGPAGMELRSAMINLKNATDEKSRQEAEAQLTTASMKIDERYNDPAMARMAAMAEAFPELKALQGAKQQYEQNQSAAGFNYYRNQGMSPEAARANQDAQIGNRQQGKDAQERPLSLGQQITQINMVTNRDAAIGAGLAWDKLNTALDKATPNIKKIADELSRFNPVRESMPSGNNTSNEGKGDQNRGQYPPAKEAPISKDIGTLGTTGQTFEPKDIIALLHKDERVLNPKENKDLTNLYEMIGNLKAKGDTEKGKEAPEIEPATTTKAPEEAGADHITLKEVHDSLERLNSTMQMMAEHTADMKDSNRTTADMSQKMTGNRLAV